MKRKIRKIDLINVNDIKNAGFNPPERTERKKLLLLREKILQVGEIINPLILSRDLYCIDGHRRLAIARELGWPLVPAIIVEYGLQEGWAILNGGTRAVTAGDWLSAAAHGMDTVHMPKTQRLRIDELRALVDVEGLLMLAERKKSTWLITIVHKVARLIGDESPEYMADVVRWLAKHNMQYGLRRAMENGDLEAIAFAIANDQPLESIAYSPDDSALKELFR